MASDFVWRCECGHMEHIDLQPVDCPRCLRIGRFIRVPEEMLDETTEEEILSLNGDDDE